MAAGRSKVLIVDDDPSHLEIYGLLIERAGYESYPVLVKFAGVVIPADAGIGLALLDYKLHSLRTSTEIAQEIRGLYPQAPIVLLSDLWSMPSDISPYISEFVRKGQPAKLLETVARLLQDGGEPFVAADPASPPPSRLDG
jgi:DNA-binding NtrC family response regulator